MRPPPEAGRQAPAPHGVTPHRGQASQNSLKYGGYRDVSPEVRAVDVLSQGGSVTRNGPVATLGRGSDPTSGHRRRRSRARSGRLAVRGGRLAATRGRRFLAGLPPEACGDRGEALTFGEVGGGEP